jgi:hypothetical protein
MLCGQKDVPGRATHLIQISERGPTRGRQSLMANHKRQ